MTSNQPVFGGKEIPDKYRRYDSAKVVILPVPYEGTVCYGKGTRLAPERIIEASRYQEMYDDELGKLNYLCGIATLPTLRPAKTPEKMIGSVENACQKEINNGKFVIMLGGEHSISYGFYLALKKKYNKLSVIQIDAHADLRDSYTKGHLSHGCVMRRICETCKSTAQIGIRSICEEETAYIKDKGKDIYWAKDIIGKSDWVDEMLSKLSNDIFLTIDVDGFDPSVFQHTGTPEPGGISWYQGLEIFKRIFSRKNVVGMDLVEVASDKTSRNSEYTAAKLIYRLIGYKFN